MDTHRTPFWDSSLPIDKRLDYLLSNLTLEEKLGMLATSTPAVERLGIGAFHLGGEAAHGVEARHDQGVTSDPEPTTSFTQPIGMSASWDTELIERAGEVVGTEARVLYHRHGNGGLARWAPTVDMERDPRWGRNEEGYGEDPYLTGKMASAYIRGMQGRDPRYLRMSAAVKHFYANNVEEGRAYKSSSIDPRNKHEYYLEPFRRCVEEGHVESMMTSYNEINGVPGMLNTEVRDTVRGEWGLSGHVVCDGGDMVQTVNSHRYCGTHAETVAEGLRAGVDAFTDDPREVERAAREAYALGLITEQDIDRALRASFGTKLRLGVYDAVTVNPYDAVTEADLNSEHNRKICLKMAEESLVLLKNDGLLPLNRADDVAVIGPAANEWYKDWYCGIPPYSVSLLAGIEKNLGRSVRFEDGLDHVLLRAGGRGLKIDADGRLAPTDGQGDEFVLNDFGSGSVTLLHVKSGKYLCSNEYDKRVFIDKAEVFGWFVRELFEFVPVDGGYHILSWNKAALKADGGHFSVADNGAPALFTLEVVKDGKQAAAGLAKQCKAVIAALGCNPVINSKEEIDRGTLALPPMQEQLLQAVHAANPNTVLTLMSNYPYSINWADERVPAILLSATGSQEMGAALAGALFGDFSPAGRLNQTWYRSDGDLPDIDDYDVIKGKRTYRYFDGEPLYPFGYGLSYTKFAYGDLTARVVDPSRLAVSLRVQNTGDTISDEVVQIFARALDSRVKRPIAQLAAFTRLHDIRPGETRGVAFEIPTAGLSVFDVISGRLLVEAGRYELVTGPCDSEAPPKAQLEVPGVKIGRRNPAAYTAADSYDDYENIYLHRGSAGYSAAVVKDAGKPAMLLYKNFDMSAGFKKLVLNLRTDAPSHFQVFANNVLLVAWGGECSPHFGNIEIPLGLDVSDADAEVRIEIQGQVRVCRFRWE